MSALLDVVIQTFNEEANLPHTLASLAGWVNHIYVVDSGSTDKTRDIATAAGATVVEHAWEGYARQKNWALANLPLKADWTMIVDADEAVSEELKQELIALTNQLAGEVAEAGFFVNRVFVFLGKRIKHCGYFPSWNLRVFKRGMARYEERLVHEHMICDGPVGKLRRLLIHEDRRGLEHFFAKHNRYSTLEAEEIYQRPDAWPGFDRLITDGAIRRRFAKSRILPVLPIAWMWRWVYMYICRLGFLDGRAGWWLCHFIAQYEFSVQLKLRELRRIGRGVRSEASLSEVEGELQGAGPTVSELTKFSPNAGVAPAGAGSFAPLRSPTAAPTLIERRGALFPGADGRGKLEFVSPWTFRQNVARALWMVVAKCLFRLSFHNWYGWRRLLLRLFGAKVGRSVRVRPTAHIEIPWNIDLREGAVIGDYAILYSLGPITVGKRAVVSQYAHLCAGTHDYHYRDFPLIRPPIVIGDDAWIAADAFVGPNVTVGARSVIGARSSVFNDIPSDVVAVGNPAKPVKARRIYREASDERTPEERADRERREPINASRKNDHPDNGDGVAADAIPDDQAARSGV